MNEATQEIASYLEKLPPNAREIISHANWESKVNDIGKKYSLTDDQVVDIGYEVLFVLVGMEPQEDLSANVESELGVSSILSDQIAEEIGSRIINPLIKQIEQSEDNSTTEPTEAINESDSINTLDIPPVNLPGEVMEEEPVVKQSLLNDQVKDFFAPATTPIPTPISNEIQKEPVIEPEITPAPSNLIHPIETPLEEIAPKPQSFITNKLTQPTAPTQAPQKYSADPYREPYPFSCPRRGVPPASRQSSVDR